MQRLISDINNATYKPVYLLYGNEAYLRIQYKNRLKDALSSGGDDMNYAYYQGKDINVAQIIDLAETLPFFADRRAIFLENTGFLKDDNEQLSAYLSDGIPDTTVIVFIESEVDKRKKLYKTIDKKGLCVCFDTQKDDVLKKWVLSKLKKEDKQITGRTLDVFLETVGDDMFVISSELDKLIAYTYGRNVITEEDVREVCTVRLSLKVFDMIEMIGLRKSKEAIRMYHELLFLKESPFGILALIIRQFNLMLLIADLSDQGRGRSDIAGKVGLSEYVVGKYLSQIRHFTLTEIKDGLRACADTDQAIKTGNMDSELGVEMLILKCSRTHSGK